MNKPTAVRKKIYLINRDFQLRYTKVAVLVGLCSTLLTLFLILWPLFQFGILRFPNFLPTPFVLGIIIAALLNFGIIAFMGIFLTHRIAGPMFSLVRQMRQIQSGNYKAYLQVRETDDLRYLVRNYNELVDYLAAVTGADLEVVETLRKHLQGQTQNKDVQDALTLADELRERLAARTSGQQSTGD